MAKAMWRGLFIIATVVAGVTIYLWTPELPGDLDQRQLALTVSAVNKITRGLRLLEPFLFNHTHPFETPRLIMKHFTPKRPLNSDPELKVYHDRFHGVLVRVYRPKRVAKPTPVLMYFHGGGWSLGDLDSEDAICRTLAKQAEVTVVSVDYRLAPEYAFPAGLEDCMAATLYVLKQGLESGMDPNRVGVSGFSAGGNLAASVAIRLGGKGFQNVPRLKYQVLVAACLQGADLNLPAYADNDLLTGGVLSRRDMALFYLSYAGLELTDSAVEEVCNGQHTHHDSRRELDKHLGIKRSEDAVGPVNKALASMAEPVLLNYFVSPLFAPENALKNQPPALVLMGSYDVLRDDSVLYVKRLHQAGVDVTSHMLKNGHHLSMFMSNVSQPGSETAADAYQKIAGYIRDKNSKGL